MANKLKRRNRARGVKPFLIIWFGQAISLTGTGMTRFALMIWAWDLTGQATTLTLVGVFAMGPAILLSPIAGALVDRWNRKFVMMGSDFASGIVTIAILILHLDGSLAHWHIYVAAAFTGAFEAFQHPAYTASITLMIPRKHYARDSGMLTLAEYLSIVAAPLFAGILLSVIGLQGILLMTS